MRRPRRTWGQRLLLTFNCLLILVCLAAAAGLVYAGQGLSDVPRISLGSALTENKPASEPQNILLVGIDDGSELPAGDPVLRGRDTSYNTDTIMILRVDPGSDQAALLSLPRDLWVTIGDTSSMGRINSAQALGGPETLIATINNNFQIEIDHYAQVNFAGFRDLVSAIDGVPIYFPWPARDTHSGLAVEEPGCITLDPDQALGLNRSRYFEKYENDKWRSDPLSDLGRIQRQQVFIRAALKRAVNKGVRNPFTLNELVNVAKKSVKIDDSFTGSDIVNLGMEFRNFNPDSLVLYSPPVVGFTGSGGASLLKLGDGAEAVFDVFRGVSDEDDLIGATTVEVRNGSGVSGQGAEALDAFGALGFTTVRSIDSNNFPGPDTVVLFAPGQEAKAVEVARYIDGPLRFQEDTGLTDVNIAVVTGDAFVGIRAEPVDAGPLEAQLPTSTTTTSESTSVTEAPTTTTTTAPNSFIPEPPPGITCS